MPAEIEEDLSAEKLTSGDRPSLVTFGMVGAQAIRETQMAVFMVDVLGRVCLMPPTAVQVLHRPRIPEDELDAMSEDDAIRVLTAQGDSDEAIMLYLQRRSLNAV